MRLDGKVALITGGGSGMGKIASELFAGEGANVVLTDVNDEAGEATATGIGGRAHYVHADVSKEADAESMVAAAVERFGRLDVLYNNAGIMPLDDGSVTDADGSIWDTVLAVNVKGVMFGCKFGIPAMLETGGGSIINVASFVAWLGAATSQTAYTASKGARARDDEARSRSSTPGRASAATRCAPGRSRRRSCWHCCRTRRRSNAASCTSRWGASVTLRSSRRRLCSSPATTPVT